MEFIYFWNTPAEAVGRSLDKYCDRMLAALLRLERTVSFTVRDTARKAAADLRASLHHYITIPTKSTSVIMKRCTRHPHHRTRRHAGKRKIEEDSRRSTRKIMRQYRVVRLVLKTKVAVLTLAKDGVEIDITAATWSSPRTVCIHSRDLVKR